MINEVRQLNALVKTDNYVIPNGKLRKGSLEYDLRNKKIVELYLKHKSYNEICKELDLTIGTVRNIIEKLIKEWQRSDVKKLQALKWAELERINLIEAEMWEAWHLSKRKPKKITMNAVSGQIIRDKAGNVIDNDIKPSRKRQEVTEEERFAGDMVYMETIKWCSKRRSELLGLDTPKKFVETADIEGNKSKAEFTRDEILAKLEKLSNSGAKELNTVPDYIDAEVEDVPKTHQLLIT